ncbi:MAG: hypothetical protein AAFP86_17950, partial [Planctomycetota bacterium]
LKRRRDVGVQQRALRQIRERPYQASDIFVALVGRRATESSEKDGQRRRRRRGLAQDDGLSFDPEDRSRPLVCNSIAGAR